VPLKDIVKEMIPFHVSMTITLFLITYVPWFTLVVPRLLGYKG
jgi:TRAP-type C4-dicarboxylate transport system permease large subunit